MDYNYDQLARLLAVLGNEREQLIISKYIEEEYFDYFNDVFELCNFIENGWAILTEDGQSRVKGAWWALCEIRGLDKETTPYATPEVFFGSQMA